MIPSSRAADYPFESGLSPDFVDWPYLQKIFAAMPGRFHEPVSDAYRNRYGNEGQYGANVWIGEVGQTVTVRGNALAASDAELCNMAKKLAGTVSGMLADMVGCTSEVLREKLEKLCNDNGVEIPDAELRGMIARLTDNAWWRRQLRRTAGRKVEGFARSMGLVQRRAGLYVSDETLNRHQEQQKRNLAALENTEAVNSEGEAFNLAELAALGVSNPSVRFAELMVRVRGMESHARANGHIGVFVTGTAPSRMHARHKESGNQVELFDGTVPRDAQQWISRQWSRVRSALVRLGAKYYGVRVAEPHHDGTPHWHMLIFIKPDLSGGRSAVGRFMAIVRRYLLRGDWKGSSKKELIEQGRAQGLTVKAATLAAGAACHWEKVEQRRAERADTNRRRRACDFKLIDWAQGSAAGYLVKYLAKNISGERVGKDDDAENPEEVGPPKPATETAKRVLAWASCWGIRQFQVLGGPPVGVWRELRRIKEAPEQLELFPAWEATGSKAEDRRPDWGNYIAAQGGIECKREDRPVQLAKLEEPGRLTKYLDHAPSRVVGVVCAGVTKETRTTVWTIRKAQDVSQHSSNSGRQFKAAKAAPQAAKRNGAGGLGLGLPLGFDLPRTRVNNCTQRTPGAWPGLAKNMAGWESEGNRVAVLEIFNEVRRLKSGTSSRKSA